jgi:L-amino acid N-acyltransferase YncA
VIIRPVMDADVEAVAAIYGHHVLHGLGTFEETPPAPEEMARRMAAVTSHDLPYLVADDGGVVGFAYAGPFRPRAAYRFTVEDSVYVASEAAGKGVGKALMTRLIEMCEANGLRQMIAVIGDSGNASSIGLHRALGFEMRGVAAGAGYKHGRWVDIVWMQRALNGGVSTAPDASGLILGVG